MHKKTTACTYNALLPALCFRVHQHVPRRLLLRAVPHLHALPVTDAEHARRLGRVVPHLVHRARRTRARARLTLCELEAGVRALDDGVGRVDCAQMIALV
jgi:ABC-type cobalamin transport system permease subunit